MNSLGERIRSARESAGFTQEKLAERAGVSRSAVARWETNDIEPNLNHLVLLSKNAERQHGFSAWSKQAYAGCRLI